MNETQTTQQSEHRSWQSICGPVQSKRVREALMAINQEGRTYVERTGVVGDTKDFTFFSPFSVPRAEAATAWQSIGDRFNWQVTRDNYAEVIKVAGELVESLKPSRQVHDLTRTLEQEAELQRRMQADVEKRRAEALELAEKQRKGTEVPTIGYNVEHNGIELHFTSKPSEAVREVIKNAGFRWSRAGQVWYKRYNPDAWIGAHRLFGLEVTITPPEAGGPDRFDMAVEDRMAEAAGVAH